MAIYSLSNQLALHLYTKLALLKMWYHVRNNNTGEILKVNIEQQGEVQEGETEVVWIRDNKQ